MFMNGFPQEILILLFNRAIYLNLGWLPCLLQQIFVKVRCLSLVCELLPSETEGAVWDRQRIARAPKLLGKTFKCLKKILLASVHQWSFVPGTDAHVVYCSSDL